MIPDKQLAELEAFKGIEGSLPLRQDPSYANLVVWNRNEGYPVHRWYRFKEGYSADLLRRIIEYLGPILGKRIRILDPFCGVGTTLVASQELSALGYMIEAVGIERNPFLAFTARTKIRWPEINTETLLELGNRVLSRSEQSSPQIPPLSSLSSGKCISRYFSQRILAIQNAIRSDGETASHDALLLGLAACIEPVSRVRKDGRALRIVDRGRHYIHPMLRSKWQQIAGDAKLMQDTLSHFPRPQVIVGDGRVPTSTGIEPGSVDLVITSPPYPNNIDYSEVYKLELWLLGFITDPASFLALRNSTFRSHPRCSGAEPGFEFLDELRHGGLKTLLEPILRKLSGISTGWRRKVLIGYFSDLWVSLREQYRCLRDNGYVVLVLGNSLHDGVGTPYLIPADLAVALISKCIGFKVEDFIVARALKRRLTGNHFLRESVLILKKNHA